jgi:hypothetical protein
LPYPIFVAFRVLIRDNIGAADRLNSGPGEENRVGYGLLHHVDAKIRPMMLMPINPRFEGMRREVPSGFASVAPAGPRNRSLR